MRIDTFNLEATTSIYMYLIKVMSSYWIKIFFYNLSVLPRSKAQNIFFNTY